MEDRERQSHSPCLLGYRGPSGHPGSSGYDASLCSFADANTGGGPTAPDDKTFHSILAIGQLGESVVNPLEDITAVRYVEKRNGGAYGYIEVHGGAHTVHGAGVRADFGKTRDFDTSVELLKFMNYAYSDPTSIGKGSPKRPSRRLGVTPTFSGVVGFGDRNAMGRKSEGTRSPLSRGGAEKAAR